MTIPASLLRAVDTHACFSGCYDADSDAFICSHPTQPPERTIQVQCEDCLGFHVGTLARLLPTHMTAAQLAHELSEHVRKLRGYTWSIGGYHYSHNRLWLSAAYYPCGLFVLDASHNARRRKDLDVLIDAFRCGLVQPQDPRMTDPALYVTREVYLDMSAPIVPVQSMHDLLQSPLCSTSFRGQGRRVTLAEFQPLAVRASRQRSSVRTAPPPATATTPFATSPAKRPAPRVGERCPICGEQIKERPSLTDTFIGCLC